MLSLDTNLYNKSLQENKSQEIPQAIKLLCRIPNDHYFRENQGEAYPVWLIEQELGERKKNNHFKIVGRLVWALLRLGKTYEVTSFQKPQARLTEAIQIILGKNPLKRKTSIKGEDYLGGEKAYLARFHEYKSVCHLIGALELIKGNRPLSSLNDPGDIEALLKTAHGLREELLRLETPNVKMNSLFLDETLLPLPAWVKSNAVPVALEPFQDKLQEVEAIFQQLIGN